MKILLTGARGQVGQALQRELPEHEWMAFPHAALDISNPDHVEKTIGAANGIDVVVNAAAYNRVDAAETEPAQAHAINEKGPLFLARACARKKIPFVHLSTDYVFDGRKQTPYVESDAANPLSVYGKSKWAGEQAVRSVDERFLIVRTAWVFYEEGPGNFFTVIREQLKTGNIRAVTDQFSSPTYAGHFANGLETLMKQRAEGTVHLAGQGVASRFDQLTVFLREIQSDVAVQPIKAAQLTQRAPRPSFSALETERVPAVRLPDWQDGVAAYAKRIQGKTHGM